ncbi:MAG: histidine kinase [Ginsengibacter sp.]
MTGYELIFSRKPVKRIYRHVLFWAVFALHFIIQNLLIGGFNEGLKQRSFAESAYYLLFFLPVYILVTYILLYILIPVYFLKRKYALFLSLIAALVAISCISCALSGALFMHIAWQMPFNAVTFNNDKYNVVVNGLFLPITILAISGGIKIAKNWYFEQKENERLSKEKITRELQLLKNQLHPRFLFYSLRTIKRNIHLHPVLASNLILQLSDLLSYLLYESNTQWVPLEKELEIIKSYAEFQKRSMMGSLDTEISISGITSGQYVVPLLLLSFLETAFDVVMKENQKHRFLKLFIAVGSERLDYHLSYNYFLNNFPDASTVKGQFCNLEKQLRLTYPETHELNITVNGQSINIKISLPLYQRNLEEDIIVKEEVHELL